MNLLTLRNGIAKMNPNTKTVIAIDADLVDHFNVALNLAGFFEKMRCGNKRIYVAANRRLVQLALA